MKTMKSPYLDALDFAALWAFFKGLVPGAFGAAIAVTMEKSATFGQKLIQFAAGIIISYYVSAAVHALTDFGPMVQQSIAFTLGMIGYESARAFTSGAAKTAADIPQDLWGWIKSKLPGGSHGSSD